MQRNLGWAAAARERSALSGWFTGAVEYYWRQTMSDAIQFHSRVGDDGILNVRLNLGRTEAAKEVLVTIEPLCDAAVATEASAMPWHNFVEQTYGSCANLGLEPHEQGTFETRERIE
jgi:hypothetical protein